MQRVKQVARNRFLLRLVDHEDFRHAPGLVLLGPLRHHCLGLLVVGHQLVHALAALSVGPGDDPHRAELELIPLQVQGVSGHVLGEVGNTRLQALLDLLRRREGLVELGEDVADLRVAGIGLAGIDDAVAAVVLGAVQQAFLEQDAFQCGYCTPGQIMSVEGLLRDNPAPNPGEIRRAMSGNLCRCGAYAHIYKAVGRAAKLKAAKGGVS